jgi:DMSO/TMAO reductase YedYZ heme-binding membrane subunit
MTWNNYFTILQNVSTRYFFIAGILSLLVMCYCANGSGIKIQQRFPKTKDYLREIGYSIITMTSLRSFLCC